MIDDEIEKIIRGTGEHARQERRLNPDVGSICYMKDGEIIHEFVDGRIIKLDDMEAEIERLNKQNMLFIQIEELKERKYELSKREIDRLFLLITGIQEALVSHLLTERECESGE